MQLLEQFLWCHVSALVLTLEPNTKAASYTKIPEIDIVKRSYEANTKYNGRCSHEHMSIG